MSDDMHGKLEGFHGRVNSVKAMTVSEDWTPGMGPRVLVSITFEGNSMDWFLSRTDAKWVMTSIKTTLERIERQMMEQEAAELIVSTALGRGISQAIEGVANGQEIEVRRTEGQEGRADEAGQRADRRDLPTGRRPGGEEV